MTEEESNEFDEQFRCAECEGYSNDFYRWVEQKKKQWQEEAYMKGYTDTEDEFNEMFKLKSDRP